MIENREQRQSASRRGCGSGDTLAHFCEAVIGKAIGLMVQIMELDDRPEAGLQALHLHEGGNGLGIVRRQRLEESVHQLPPRPKAVPAAWATFLGHAGHGALESVAVQIGGSRDQDVDVMWRASSHRLDCGDPARVIDCDASIQLPSIRGKDMSTGQLRHDFKSVDFIICACLS